MENLSLLWAKAVRGNQRSCICWGGLDKPTAGSISYDDTDITNFSENVLSVFRRDNIGFIFQDYNLIPELTAEENIKYPVYLAKKKFNKELWDFLVKALDIDNRLAHLPSQLSGGQQQRVAIARALISDPHVVLCDEPTGNLDSMSSAKVQDILFRLNNELHKTIVIVTHDDEFAAKAGRIIRLKDGKIGGEV